MFTAGLMDGLIIAVALVRFFLSHPENWPKDEGSLDFKLFLVSTFMALPAIILPVFIVGGVSMGYQGSSQKTEKIVRKGFVMVVVLSAIGVYHAGHGIHRNPDIHPPACRATDR